MNAYRENNFHVKEFSFSEFLEIQKKPINKRHEPYFSSVTGNSEFTNTDNFQESLDLLIKGNSIECLEYEDFIKDFNFSSTENQLNLSYEGFQVEYSEYSQGNPECMIDLLETEKEIKNITINFNCAYSGYIKKDTILNYGKMILSLYSILESKGINIKIVTSDRFMDKNNICHSLEITLKEFNENIDIDRLSYCISHLSFERRNMFRLTEQVFEFEYFKQYISGHYGKPINDIPERENQISIDSPSNNLTREYFYDFLRKILEKYIQ